jgi:hypothetical protein
MTGLVIGELFFGNMVWWQGVLSLLFMIPFIVIGIVMIGVSLWIMVGRERIICNRNRLTLHNRMFDRVIWKVELDSYNITDIQLDLNVGKGSALVKIVTQDKMYKFGSGLSNEELTWLKKRIESVML